jgi:hypothetical protein
MMETLKNNYFIFLTFFFCFVYLIVGGKQMKAKPEMISIAEWAKVTGLTVGVARYYAQMERIDGQKYNAYLGRWECPKDSPAPAHQKRGPRVEA